MSGGDAKIAREAAIHSLVANGVYLLLMVGITVALTRRDWLARQALRARRVMSQDRRKLRADQQVADLRRDISAYEHREG